MAARPTWKGFLKISLVNIPVRVFPATDSAATISFNQLHGECQTRIQQKRWCPNCEREVPNSEIVKGYEFEKGRYVVMDEEDISKVRPESTRVIDLVQFTDAVAIDPIYVERPYYLAPDGQMGMDAFAVMREGMKGKAGIGKLALYGREYLVAVLPERQGPRDVHDAARQRSAQHGQHRGARQRSREGQAGRDQARQAGDSRTSKGTWTSRNIATSTRRSCAGSSTRRSPARKSSPPPRKRRRRSST